MWLSEMFMGKWDLFQRACKTQWLVVDEFGSGYSGERAEARVESLLGERIHGQLPTFVTTNKSLADIEKDSPRLASRLATFRIVHFGGPDRRPREKGAKP